jgi:hypothetical protein
VLIPENWDYLLLDYPMACPLNQAHKENYYQTLKEEEDYQTLKGVEDYQTLKGEEDYQTLLVAHC